MIETRRAKLIRYINEFVLNISEEKINGKSGRGDGRWISNHGEPEKEIDIAKPYESVKRFTGKREEIGHSDET